MNTKGIKFLAVLAVLAMAFAAFAVFEQNDAAVSENENDIAIGVADGVIKATKGTPNTNLSDFAVGADSDDSDTGVVVKVTGKATNARIAGHTAYEAWKQAAEIQINISGLSSLVGTSAYVGIEQTDSALALAYTGTGNKPIAKLANGTYTMQSYYAKATFDDNGYSILVPQDGSSVALDIYKADGDGITPSGALTAEQIAKLSKTKIATVVLDFSEFATVITLADSAIPDHATKDSAVKWWTYAYAESVGTLTIPDGNKFTNVTFVGTDVKAASGVTDALMSAHGLPVKKTIGTTTTYSSYLSGAVNNIAASTLSYADSIKSENVVKLKLLADVTDVTGVKYATTNSPYYKSFDLNLGGFTYKNDKNDVGYSHAKKVIYIDDGQTWKIYNGKIVSKADCSGLTGADKYGYALIQSYGQLTLGDGSSSLTLDVTGVKMAAGYYGFGVLTAAGVTKIVTGVTIDSGKLVAVDANYGSGGNTNEASVNNGTSETGVGTKGSEVQINGATINGDVYASYYDKTVNQTGATTRTIGTELIINSGTVYGMLKDNVAINRGATYTPLISGEEGSVLTKITVNGGTFTDYAALKYKTEKADIKIEVEGKDVDVSDGSVKDVTPAAGVATLPEITTGSTAVYVIDGAVTEVKTTADLSSKDVILAGNSTIENLNMVVAAGGSLSLTGFTSISGVISTTDGSTEQKMTLNGFVGTIAITKGSIIIDAEEWTGGEIILANGADAKIHGTAAGADLKISVADKDNDKATLTVTSEGLDITGASKLTVSKGITVVVDGDLSVATLDVTGKMTVNGKLTTATKITAGGAVTVNGTLNAADSEFKDKIDVYGVLKGIIKVSGASKDVIAYGTSNINGATITFTHATSKGVLSGKDANGGTWSFTAPTLKINGYNGNYNFGNATQFTGLTTITVAGESQIIYNATSEYEGAKLFDDILSINTVQGSGSLEIVADLSKSTGAGLAAGEGFIAVKGASISIDSVDVGIVVTGANVEWTADDIKAMKVTGIDATTKLAVFGSEIGINLMSTYEAEGVIGIITPSLDVKSSDAFAISSAGVGIDAEAAVAVPVSFSSVSLIGVKGNSAAAIVDDSDVDPTAISELQIIDCTLAAFDGDVVTEKLTIKKSAVGFGGDVGIETSAEISGKAIVEAKSIFETPKVNVAQDSEFSVKDLTITGAGSANNGTITVSGKFVLTEAADFDNLATFDNDGLAGIYGDFQSEGTFINDGSFYVYAKKFVTADNAITIVNGAQAPATGKTKVSDITITKATPNSDGTASVEATLSFIYKTGDAPFSPADLDKFVGTLSVSQVTKDYTLTLSNGSASVTVTYDPLKEGDVVGKNYTVSVSGALKSSLDPTKLRYLEAPNSAGATAATVTDDDATGIRNIGQANGAANFNIKDGTGANTSVVTLFAGATPISNKDVVYDGDLTTYVDTVTLTAKTISGNIVSKGKTLLTVTANVVGDITADGKVVVSKDKAVMGDIDAKGEVEIVGSVIGGITSEDNVTISGIVTGEVTVNTSVAKEVAVNGTFNGELIYNSKYKATKDAKEGEETTYTAKMTINAGMKTSGFTILLVAGKNATETEAVVPGSFSISPTISAPDKDKTAEITLTEGKIGFTNNVVLPERYVLTIESGTTIEVDKVVSLDVKNAGLKVSSGATANFETGSAMAVNYGKVLFVMSFTIDSGAYTIYSNVAYALTSCDEGSTLTVGEDATIAQAISIKAGVNVVVDSVTLTFNGKQVDMGEGAKITLVGTGKVLFAASGDNSGDTDVKTGDAINYFDVNGTIVFGDNAVTFDGVRFTSESSVFTVAATSTAVEKLGTNLSFDEGIATIKAGTATGTINLGNDRNVTTKGGDNFDVVFGSFVVGADGIFDAVAINDSFGKVNYKKVDGEFVIKDVLLKPTIVGVEGVLNLSATTYAKGVYSGLGVITLAADKSFIIDKSQKPADADTDNKDLTGGVLAKIVDTTDNQNGYVLNAVVPSLDKTITLKATKYKVGTESYDAMTIAGDVRVGIITATDDAFVNGLTLQENASLVADAAYIIGDSTAIGYLCAEDIYMKEGTETSEFKELDYQVTYAQGDYTVYTYFASVDFEEISDITIDGKADSYILVDDESGTPYLLPKGTTKLDLTGEDVSITVAEGKTLTIDVPLIIGTPIDALGADDGSALVGKFIIADEKYVVAYSDVDLTLVEIVQKDKKTEAVYSLLDIDDIPYATIFANEDNVELSAVDKKLVPEIEGHTFAMWVNYNLGAKWVGETNAYADFKAVLVTIIVKYVAGVDYYMDGLLFQVFDTPTDVQYGSYFTAKISDTSKYQGNPLINGVKTYTVEGPDTLVATGVEPIPAPTPEPVEENTGLTLTDILLIVLVILIAIMVVILVLRLNRS